MADGSHRTLAAAVTPRPAAGGPGQAARAEPVASLPLSFAQERLWFLSQLEPESTAYNLRAAFRIHGPLDPQVLKRGLRALVARHGALRTTFGLEGSRPVQRVAPGGRLDLVVNDLSRRPEALRAGELEGRIRDAVRQPFDLAAGPLLRPTLFRLGGDEHVLLLVAHHLVSDGWSIGILLRELLDHYEASSTGQPLALPPLPLEYGEAARRQRERLSGRAGDALAAHWKARLDGAPPLSELPTDRPRPPLPSSRGAVLSRRLGTPLFAALESLARASGCTLFMTLLAGLAAVVSRYGGQRDLVLGSPIAHRNRAEVEDLVGLFVNTLALRVDLEGDPSFRELQRRVRACALDAYDHQDLPFERLVEEVRPPRDLSRTPLFQILFSLQTQPLPPQRRGGLTWTVMDADTGGAKYDLTLQAARREDGLALQAEYATDLFEGSTIERLLGAYETLLAAAAADPETRLSRLPLLSAEERRLLVAERDATAAPFPAERDLHELFLERAARTPEGEALRGGAGSMTYAELAARAGALSRRLAEAGVGAETPVGLCLERSPGAVAGILGILGAGGAWVPVDPAHPPARQRFVVEDAGLRHLVTAGACPPGLAGLGLTVVSVEDGEAGDRAPTRRSALAYVLPTSGSTGRPKGVMGLHRGVLNRLAWMWRALPYAPGEVCCQKTALGFVDSVAEIFGPLLRGVPLVIVPDEDVRDPRRLVDALAAHGVTRIVLVPSLLRAMLDAVPDLARRLPALTLWTSSGEPLPAELARRFREALPHARLLNLYGCSEVSADSLWHDASHGDLLDPVPIGRPIANTRAYVLDAALEPLPAGVPGELCLGGDGLARGYLHRPNLTAERFVPDPFGGPGERLYRTGDRARRLADGSFQFLGRLDDQVKLRGHRIEPGEIEAALRGLPGVRDAAVALRGAPGAERLVAYVVPDTGGVPAVEALRERLRGTLPAAMVPSAVVLLDALPRTDSGKVDRLRLPEPGGTEARRARAAEESVAPRGELERRLRDLWQELLEVEPVGVTDDFFDLGGSSLLAVTLVHRIEELTGSRVPLATLLQAPTIAELARRLGDEAWTASWDPLVALRPGGSKRPFFCVPGLGGHVLHFRDLARHLDPERPFFGLQARGLGDGRLALDVVEDIAALYVEAIRTVQRQGPYLLGGTCFGGTVAFEMARQLRQEGEEVSLLVLMESYAPGSHPFRRTTLGRLGRTVARLSESMRGAGFGTRAALFLGSVVRGGGIFGQQFRRAIRPESRDHEMVRQASMRAMARYVPGPYEWPIAGFVGAEGAELAPDMGWGALTSGGIEMRRVPGNHRQVLREPNVAFLARQVSERLDAAGRTDLASAPPAG